MERGNRDWQGRRKMEGVGEGKVSTVSLHNEKL